MTNEQLDYESLSRQYTALNAKWAAQSREVAALRTELQAAADAMHLAANQVKHQSPDVSARLTNQWSQANRLLGGR